jgi:hypothetical protein
MTKSCITDCRWFCTVIREIRPKWYYLRASLGTSRLALVLACDSMSVLLTCDGAPQ